VFCSQVVLRTDYFELFNGGRVVCDFNGTFRTSEPVESMFNARSETSLTREFQESNLNERGLIGQHWVLKRGLGSGAYHREKVGLLLPAENSRKNSEKPRVQRCKGSDGR
jgi:hypothetical protein